MIGMALAKSIYAVPTWTRTVALVREYRALRAAVCGSTPDLPSVYACYRFATKLRQYGDILVACLDRVTASLHAQRPEIGRNIAIGNGKNDWALSPLRVRGLDRVRLPANLSILAKLACALSRERAAPSWWRSGSISRVIRGAARFRLAASCSAARRRSSSSFGSRYTRSCSSSRRSHQRRQRSRVS
jgi:hypothetical protein